MENPPLNFYRLKLFMLGDCRVGKTSYINRLCQNKFTEYVMTVGCDIQMKEYTSKKGTKIMVDIWDTAGQEKFKSLTKTMIKNADGVLLLYDITDRKSFINIHNWLQDINNFTKDIKIILIGNKCEMENERQIKIEEAKAITQEHNILFYEVSCQNNINIEEAFNAIVTAINDEKESNILQCFNNLKSNNFDLEKEEKKSECC